MHFTSLYYDSELAKRVLTNLEYGENGGNHVKVVSCEAVIDLLFIHNYIYSPGGDPSAGEIH